MSLWIALTGCADFSSSPQEVTEVPEATEDLGYIEVKSPFQIGSICPFGSVPAPKPVIGALWDCEESRLEELSLRESAPSLQFLADCRKRLLTLRSERQQLDLTWQVLPDGRFVIPVEKPISMTLTEDQPNLGACQASTQLVVSGQMDCVDVDRPEIQVDLLWYLAPDPASFPTPVRSPVPSPSPSPSASPSPPPQPEPSPSSLPSPLPSPSPSSSPTTIAFHWSPPEWPSARVCQLPKSCFIHVPHRFKQCE